MRGRVETERVTGLGRDEIGASAETPAPLVEQIAEALSYRGSDRLRKAA